MCRFPLTKPYENVSVGHWVKSVLPLTSIFVPPPSRTLHFFLWEMGRVPSVSSINFSFRELTFYSCNNFQELVNVYCFIHRRNNLTKLNFVLSYINDTISQGRVNIVGKHYKVSVVDFSRKLETYC